VTVREQFIVGIDLGGTNIAAGAMPTDGTREIAMRMAPTHGEEGSGAVAERIVRMIEDVIEQSFVYRAHHYASRNRADLRAGVSLSERKTLTPALTTGVKLTQNWVRDAPQACLKFGVFISILNETDGTVPCFSRRVKHVSGPSW